MIISKKSKTNRDKLIDLTNHTTANGECKEWKGCLNTDGYPRMVYNRNCNTKVHRLVASLFYEQDITGLVVRHTCDNPKCINPSHLKLGTPKDNMKDREERGRTFIRYTSEIVQEVRSLLSTNQYTHKEISELTNIDPRRVSDIYTGNITR